jgi:prevent-host-death family protein
MMVMKEGPARKGGVAESVNVAEAKKRLSDLLGRVAYGGETVLITRRGRPMARLVPPDQTDAGEGLVGVRGWLDDEDPFFDNVDAAVAARARHRPRAYAAGRRGPR